MRIPRIYLPSKYKTGQSIELTEHAFQHAIKVLRLKQNSKLVLFDGLGNEFSAIIEAVNKKNAFVKIKSLIDRKTESNLSIHLGLGISKGERMDFAIQKSVELGVTEITPLFTEHCVVNLDEKRIQKKLHHWQGIIISACEQCGRSVVPRLNTASTLLKWADTISQTCIVFDPLATATLKNITPENGAINLLIGPEGGLSTNEISELKKKDNFKAIKFGPRILRTETAAVSAMTAIQLLWGDLL
ncbi:MAG: 16S rRNA (uracil(1498)-N(3))-methyltransferase [Gammaproteobacteria bacterium]|nr:16S rRNA (uracil(1498)-N(3))-methyltransferase [Gammaproteobacteria bacterium]